MSLSVHPYTRDHISAVERMNQRMKEAGSTWGFYTSHIPYWLPKPVSSDQTTWQEYYVVADETAEKDPAQNEVRGAYCLKPQLFRWQGKDTWMASWQGPVSEGLVDSKYGVVAALCLREMTERQPLLFGLGAGDRLQEMLRVFGWNNVGTPLQVRVLNPARFLRQARVLRTTPGRARLFDFLAASGIARIGFPLVQLLKARFSVSAQAEEVDHFGDWADEIWKQARDHYTLIASRDAQTLNAQMARENWIQAKLIRVISGGVTIGWGAIRFARMEDNRRFGDMAVGTIVDALALPGRESAVLGCLSRELARQGPDMIITHMTHKAWRTGLGRAGFLELPGRRSLSLSPDLADLLDCSDAHFFDTFHFTPIDGDGPHGL